MDAILILSLVLLVAAAVFAIQTLRRLPATQPPGLRELAWAVLLLCLGVIVWHIVPLVR